MCLSHWPDMVYEWLNSCFWITDVTSIRSSRNLLKFSDLKLFSLFAVVPLVCYICGDNCTLEQTNKSDNIFLIRHSICQRELNLQQERVYVFISEARLMTLGICPAASKPMCASQFNFKHTKHISFNDNIHQ